LPKKAKVPNWHLRNDNEILIRIDKEVILMEIEVSRVFKFDGDGPVKAMADIIIEGQFAVKGFRVVNGKKGLFVGAPGKQSKDGKWYDCACPVTEEAKQLLTEAVLKAYEEDSE